jgi:hypothetical protein
MESKKETGITDVEKHFERIEQFISFENAKEAASSLSLEEKIKFLSEYYFSDSFSYDEAISKRIEESQLILEKELDIKSTPPYSPEVMVAMLNLCKTSIVDQMIDSIAEVHKNYRSKIEEFKITDIQATVLYQLGMGSVGMKYNQQLALEIQNECKSRGMNLEEFMKQAMPALTNDFSIFFDFDGYVALKSFDLDKDSQVEISKVMAYSKRTIEYTQLLLEDKVEGQSVMIFPSLMNQFLIQEFGINNYQVINCINEALKSTNLPNMIDFINQILEEIWYVERGKGLIYMIFKHQIEMIDQMTTNNAVLKNTEGNFNEKIPGMPAFPLPGVNDSQAPDIEKLQKAMESMDLSQLEAIMPEMKEMMELMNNQNKK